MRQALTIHPNSLCTAVTSIEVDAARPRPGALDVSYRVMGATGDLSLPPAATPARTDQLWRRTCFEAFVRAVPGEAYVELNLAPSRQWATYLFSGRRTGMRVAGEVAAPRIEVLTADDRFELHASVDLGALPDLPSDAIWRLGLCAVIEEASGRKSYWALAHPPGRPDFHHADAFAIDLPPGDR